MHILFALSIDMTTLKDLTISKHREAEAQPFIQSMIAGQVSAEKYADYLYQLYHVYQRLEQIADNLGLLDGIESIKRTELIWLDYQHLSQNKEHAVRTATQGYVDYLNSIADSPNQILAHIYVRHMGDMFGGQILSRVLPGANHMYKFENLSVLIANLRQRVGIELADEANKAFDLNIDLVKEYND